MFIVSRQRMNIQLWMVITVAAALLSIVAVHHGNAFASGAVIVAQLSEDGPSSSAQPPSLLLPVNSAESGSNKSHFQIVVKDYAEDDNQLTTVKGGAAPSASNETDKTNSPSSAAAVSTTKSPTNHSRRSLKSGGMVSPGTPSASRNNTQLLSVLAARRSLLHNRNGNVPHQRGAHNYVIQQTMCERNCTKNFTVRGSAQCMRRCAIPSPARRRGDPQASATISVNDEPKINSQLENDNNLSESNSVAAADELLVTNESTANHLIYREIFVDASFANNSNRGGGGNLVVERNRGKKNVTLTKDLYSPLKSGQYFIDSRTKLRGSTPAKATKLEGEILEYGQKLVTTTEKSKTLPPNGRAVTMTRNLVASHRRGMLNFKSSLLPNPLSISAMPTRAEPFVVAPIEEIFTKPAVEDARTEETRSGAVVSVEHLTEVVPPPPRKNHGILLDLPPSTIQLDTRGSGGFEKPVEEIKFIPASLFEQIIVTETTENGIQEQTTFPTVAAVSESQEEAITKNIVVSTEKVSSSSTTKAPTVEITIAPTAKEEDKMQKEFTTLPFIRESVPTKDTLYNRSEDVIPSISALFPNISSVPSLLPPNDPELPLVIHNLTATTHVPEIVSAAPINSTETPKLDPIRTTDGPSSTTTTTRPEIIVPDVPSTTVNVPTTVIPSSTTTEKIPYKPLPSRGYKPSTQKPSTTLRPMIPKRPDFTPSSIDSGDFRRTTISPMKRFSPRTKKPPTTSSSTTSSTTSTTSSTTTTTITPIHSQASHEKSDEQPPNSSFESIFNLSAIFPKFPKVQVTTPRSMVEPENTTVFVIPSPTIPEADRVLLQHNTDVTIELQRMNMATYVLAGLGMFPIVIIILYVIKTIIYNKQMKNGPQAVPVDSSFADQKISPVVMKTEGNDGNDDALKEIEFPRKNLRFKSILGEGNFGQVWKAEADDLPGHLGTTRIVAVKTERPEHGTAGLKQEGEIMFKLGSHPNVVTLLGCCVQDEPHLLIMEFAMRGRLLSLLRAARSAIHSMGGNPGTVRSSAIPLSPRRLSGFAHDIARGMEYIASKNIVHRDLAARNILLDHNGVCKICDFGMSMDLKKHKPLHTQSRTMGRGGLHHNSFENNLLWENEATVHKSGTCPERRFEICRSDSGVGGTKPSRPALPIRWMAPEALLHHIFSIETDVWAFGIVLWEIATLGCTPYPNLSGREVVRSIPSGVRPEIPPNCRPELYKLMAKTWHKDPRQRPSFSEARNELAHALRQWEMEQENTSEYLDVSGFSEDLEHGMVYFNRRISEFECEI